MKQKLLPKILFVVWIALGSPLFAQKNFTSLPLTADSLATGNSKDVFKSFFQLAVDRLASNNKEIQFSSNPFAVMAKTNPNLLIDTNYIKYTALRNLNFSFAGKLDSSYKFNGFSSGIKYALINQRDETVSKFFVSSTYRAFNEFNNLNDSLSSYIASVQDIEKKISLNEQRNKMFNGELAFSELDKDFQDIIKKKAQELNAFNFLSLLNNNSNLNVRKAENKIYDSLRNLFQKRLLWTVGISDTTYKNQFLFSNVVLSTELLKGISNPNTSVGSELNLKGAVNFIDDTLETGKDLKRSLLIIEPAINIIFRNKQTLYSWGEFKLGATYLHTFTGLYRNEKKDSLTLNATLRIRIINDVWVPLEVKYDPKNGNVFGFLNVRANFNGLKDLFGNKK